MAPEELRKERIIWWEELDGKESAWVESRKIFDRVGRRGSSRSARRQRR